MKIKKYNGATEKDAMLKVKNELGPEALIVSVKNVKPKGVYKLFKKPYVEITAALEENIKKRETEALQKEDGALDDSFITLLREFSKKSDEQISKELQKDTVDKPKQGYNVQQKDEVKKVPVQTGTIDIPILKVIYDQLVENEIDEKYINRIMNGFAEIVYEQGSDIDELISIVYKRIAKIISDYEPIKVEENKSNVVVFIGPTGVGKTTTIAKIASHFTLNMKKKVALVTADTYRIAAVEQLRTYANILNIPIKAVYSSDELKNEVENFKEYDLVLVDTAGRSPKNSEHHEELRSLLNALNEKEIYLVLSLSTKYKDLIKVSELYNEIDDYKIIFTKLDETMTYGNLLNIKMLTDAKLSYVTFGQNVPDDISEIDIHDITKKVLGGC